MTFVSPFSDIFGGLLQSFGEIYIIIAVLMLILFGIFMWTGIDPIIALALCFTPLLLMAVGQVFVIQPIVGVVILLFGVILAAAFAKLFLR